MNAPELLLVFLLLLPACRIARPRPVIRGTVVHVVDGDTIDVRPDTGGLRVRVRVLGIDCPESHRNEKCIREGARGGMTRAAQIPNGLAAARRTSRLVFRRPVTLEPEGADLHDRYGRLLAYVRRGDGSDLGLILVREGLCADYSAAFPHPRAARYRASAALLLKK
jgi:micrococcal nuclease